MLGHCMAKHLLGKLAAGAVGMLELPRLALETLEGFRALGDLTGTTSDALDQLGIAAVVPGSVLKPTNPKARLVGQAVTVLNRKIQKQMNKSRLAEIEAHHLAEPGDVLVIQGVAGISSMGGISASVGKRQGEAGAIVDGAVRDAEELRELGFAVYAVGANPNGPTKFGPGRINWPISCGGVAVSPGDLVVGDADGVVVVEREKAASLLEDAAKKVADERARLDDIAKGRNLRPKWLEGALRAAGVLKVGETL